MPYRERKITLGAMIWDVLKDILFFPFWWYSFGLFKVLSGLKDFLSERQKSLGLGVWIKNVFVPMYGQRDWQGFLISVFIRIVQIVFRSIAMLFWALIAFALFWLWLLFPALVVYLLIGQFI